MKKQKRSKNYGKHPNTQQQLIKIMKEATKAQYKLALKGANKNLYEPSPKHESKKVSV